MRVSPEALRELKAIYLTEFGEHLSDDEALEIADRLLSLFTLLSRSLPADGES
jgi:hypothetical protein